MMKAPPSWFLRVLLVLRVMVSVIFVMVSFWATSILYTPFFDNFDDILPATLLDGADVQFGLFLASSVIDGALRDELIFAKPMAYNEVDEWDIN
jgi:hypothetical protein